MNQSRSEDQYPPSRDGSSEWPQDTPTQPRVRGSGEETAMPRRPLMPSSSPVYTSRAPGSQRPYMATGRRHPYDPPDQPPGWPAQPGYGAPDRRPLRPTPAIDISTLTIADWLILGDGLLTFFGTFLPWLSVSLAQRVIDTLNGWYFAVGKATMLIGLLTLALFAVRLFEVKLPFQIPWPDRAIYLALGVVGALFALFYVLDAAVPRVHVPSVSTTPAVGVFLVFFATVTIAIGGYLMERMRAA